MEETQHVTQVFSMTIPLTCSGLIAAGWLGLLLLKGALRQFVSGSGEPAFDPQSGVPL